MGALKDKAKQQSKFLMLEKGESIVVQFIDYQFVPSELDPTTEVALFQFKEDGAIKFWKNGSAKVFNALDSVNKGDYVKITRGKFIKKDGSEDTNKSSWSAVLLPGYNPKTGEMPAQEPIVQPDANPQGKQATPEVAGPFK